MPGRHPQGIALPAAGAGLLAVLLAIAACSAKHDPAAGEILLAIDANLKVPSDIDQIGVSVQAQDGTVASIDQVYPMAPVGAAEFPATLAIVRGTSQPIDIKVAAYKNGSAFILREAITTIPSDRTAILRLDLDWLDEGSTSGVTTQVQSLATATCGAQETSADGTCTSFELDSAGLATFTDTSLVRSDGASCADVDDCLLGAAAVALPAPVEGTTISALDGGTLPTCTVAAPTFSGPFNLGIVPASGAAGWCNGSGCVVPLANDVGDVWTPDSGGRVHLPLALCTDARVASLVAAPVTASCPQYGAAHPACQDYGREAGATTADGGPVRTSDGSADAGLRFIVGARSSTGTPIGLAYDEVGNAYAFYALGGGTNYLAQAFDYGGFEAGASSESPVAFDPAARSFAAITGYVAAASPMGVWLFHTTGTGGVMFLANTGADAGAPVSIAFHDGLLVAAGFRGGLMSIDPTTGVITPLDTSSFAPGTTPYLVVEEPSSGQLAIVTSDAPSSSAWIYDTTLVAGAVSSRLVSVPALEAPVLAIAYPAPGTIVYADPFSDLYALTTDDAGLGDGVQLNADAAVTGPSTSQTLAGSGGRIVYIGANQHAYTMHVMADGGASTATDLSTLASTPGVLTHVDAIGLSNAGLLWIENGGLYTTSNDNLPY